jgi:hypothetical protein
MEDHEKASPSVLNPNQPEDAGSSNPDSCINSLTTEAPNTNAAATLFPETALDSGIVGWDGQDDPQNPQNFSDSQKWALLALVSSITLVSPLASSMFSPAVGFVATDLKVTNETLLSFSVSVFLLGYTVRGLHNISRSHVNASLTHMIVRSSAARSLK